jgi:hypothetical protein
MVTVSAIAVPTPARRPTTAEPAERFIVRRVLARVAPDPFFLGHDLVAFQRRHALDDAALAAYLACPLEQLSHLALYRRPEPGTRCFTADVDRVAARTGAESGRLAALLRG